MGRSGSRAARRLLREDGSALGKERTSGDLIAFGPAARGCFRKTARGAVGVS